MSTDRVASRRLIDASASLDPAERALLNIWVNRGLDDTAVARMTGMSAAAVAARRDRIIAGLSRELGLPPDDIRTALADLETPADHAEAAGASTQPSPAATTLPAAAEPANAANQARGRRVARGALAALAAAVVVVLLLVLPGHHHTAPRPRRTAGPIRTTTPADPLTALPGGVTGAGGSVTLTGQGPTLTLDLTVRGLPSPKGGRYVVFLYDSLVDSQALGSLPATGHAGFRLPAAARRYRFIDIALQPPGATFDSGQSVLRTRNPAFDRSAS